MPGILEPNAVCPLCGDPLQAIVDTSNSHGVKREYYHGKIGTHHRRRNKCEFTFTNHEEAARERYMLEIHPANQ